MKRTPSRHRSFPISRKRQGATLIELLASMIAGSMLVAGLGSAIGIAARSVSISSQSETELNNHLAMVRMMADIQDAIEFTKVEDDELKFFVPDRDGDGNPEEIKYKWCGHTGHGLDMKETGLTEAVYIDNIEHFEFIVETEEE